MAAAVAAAVSALSDPETETEAQAQVQPGNEEVDYKVLERLSNLPDDTSFLDLASSGLRVLPSQALHLTGLTALFLSSNALVELPEALFLRLPTLQYLDVRFNQIERLPTSLGQHGRLRTLLLNGNRITALPVEMARLGTLSGLALADNPLYFPPAEVVAQGLHGIMAFLGRRLASEITESSFVTELEGDGGIGGLSLNTGADNVNTTVATSTTTTTAAAAAAAAAATARKTEDQVETTVTNVAATKISAAAAEEEKEESIEEEKEKEEEKKVAAAFENPAPTADTTTDEAIQQRPNDSSQKSAVAETAAEELAAPTLAPPPVDQATSEEEATTASSLPAKSGTTGDTRPTGTASSVPRSARAPRGGSASHYRAPPRTTSAKVRKGITPAASEGKKTGDAAAEKNEADAPDTEVNAENALGGGGNVAAATNDEEQNVGEGETLAGDKEATSPLEPSAAQMATVEVPPVQDADGAAGKEVAAGVVDQKEAQADVESLATAASAAASGTEKKEEEVDPEAPAAAENHHHGVKKAEMEVDKEEEEEEEEEGETSPAIGTTTETSASTTEQKQISGPADTAEKSEGAQASTEENA